MKVSRKSISFSALLLAIPIVLTVIYWKEIADELIRRGLIRVSIRNEVQNQRSIELVAEVKAHVSKPDELPEKFGWVSNYARPCTVSLPTTPPERCLNLYVEGSSPEIGVKEVAKLMHAVEAWSKRRSKGSFANTKIVITALIRNPGYLGPVTPHSMRNEFVTVEEREISIGE